MLFSIAPVLLGGVGAVSVASLDMFFGAAHRALRTQNEAPRCKCHLAFRARCNQAVLSLALSVVTTAHYTVERIDQSYIVMFIHNACPSIVQDSLIGHHWNKINKSHFWAGARILKQAHKNHRPERKQSSGAKKIKMGGPKNSRTAGARVGNRH